MIPEENWQEFLDTYNKKCNGNIITVKYNSREAGEKLIGEKVRLKELAVNSEPGEFNNTAYLTVEGPNGELTQMLDKIRFINELPNNSLELISDLGDSMLII